MKALICVIFFITVFVVTANVSCTKESICKGLQLADLAISAIQPTLASGSGSSSIYNISQIVLNTAERVTCDGGNCVQKIQSSNDNTPYSTQVYFSDSYVGDNYQNWGRVLNSFDTILNRIDPCNQANVNDRYSFDKNGYYLIRGLVNLANVVINGANYPTFPETSIDNNEYVKNGLSKSFAADTLNFFYVNGGVVIHVTGLNDKGVVEPTVKILKRTIRY